MNIPIQIENYKILKTEIWVGNITDQELINK